MKTIRQMTLKTFKATYDIPEDTALRWVHTKGFPAYKLGRKWYVDIKKFEKWREVEHANSYKYS